MLKELIKVLIKLIESKLNKCGLEEKILKHKEYVTTAKEIWNVVEENFRITENVEKKLNSKADEFDKLFSAKYPEISKDDLIELRQSIAGEINQGKQAVLDNSKLLQELQDENTTLKSENIDLKNKLAAISSYVPQEQGQ